MQDLDSKIRSGVAWSGLTQVSGQVANLIIAIILTRLLTPEDFGLVGMSLVFTGFATIFTDLGFGAALVQKLDVERRHENAVFWASLGLGALITVIVAAAAPYIAAFYGTPALQPLTVALSFIFVISSFKTVKVALLQKTLNFRTLAIVEFTSTVLAGVIAIYLALTGFGVWSIVALYLAAALIYVVVLWPLTPWRPSLSLRWDALRDLSKFSLNLLGFSAFNYWTRNGDNLLIGRFVGSEALGLYARSYSILLLPVWQISSVISNVMFPALSAIQDDILRVREMYLSAIAVVSLVTFPLTLGLLVVARPFVLALFGDKWAGMIPILQVFCLLAVLQSIGTTSGWLYQSQGRTDIMFRWGLVAGSAALISFVVGLRWGALGVAVAYTLVNFAFWYPNWTIPARLVKLDFTTMLRRLAPTFYGALTMAVIVGLLGLALPHEWPAALQLIVEVAIGALVYAAYVHIRRVEAYTTASRLVALYIRDVRTS